MSQTETEINKNEKRIQLERLLAKVETHFEVMHDSLSSVERLSGQDGKESEIKILADSCGDHSVRLKKVFEDMESLYN
ncbi:hypothetical protein A134_23300 [Vibrio crassostreae 9CS106]|uniref:Uncharacterized protein n=1 Tax=Vibrio crassostreae 9CS106 TaxID=1191300 RepID=A0A1B1C3H1_9VIBR|nr:hypothetical protein A134_23300 [Vibrio crassostreae 9CS106]